MAKRVKTLEAEIKELTRKAQSVASGKRRRAIEAKLNELHTELRARTEDQRKAQLKAEVVGLVHGSL